MTKTLGELLVPKPVSSLEGEISGPMTKFTGKAPTGFYILFNLSFDATTGRYHSSPRSSSGTPSIPELL